LPTGPGFLDAFFGAQLAGAVPVPLYPPLHLARAREHAEALQRMLGAVGARIGVSDARLTPLLPPLRWLDAARLPSGSPAEAPPSDLALLQFSSGATAEPKAIALTRAELDAQSRALLALIAPSADDACVSWLPLYHDMGLIGCLLTTRASGRDLVLIPPEAFIARPALWLRALSRHRGTVSAAPSFAYALAARRIRDDELVEVDLSRWRLALCGAEPVAPRALAAFARRFRACGFDAGALVPVYGLAEAGLAVTFSPIGGGVRTLAVDARALAEDGEARPGDEPLVSVGSAIPGVALAIRDAAGRELPERRVGRIVVGGPSVMTGYFADPEATRAVLADGWLDTGDLGFLFRGELYVCGRAKDVVVVRGANHTAEELEACLEGVAGIRPGGVVAAAGRDDDGEARLIFAERRRDAPDGLEERIRAALAARAGVVPSQVVLLDRGALPRTTSGKLRRRETVRRHLAGTLSTPRRRRLDDARFLLRAAWRRLRRAR
jgi:acyl-CoA synthetase (AMP-forming)/AMP-acid ligase II